jgi:hypothetical protein
VANTVAYEHKHSFNAYHHYLLYPTNFGLSAIKDTFDDNDNTVVASNISTMLPTLTNYRAFAASVTLNNKDVIADTGATQIFVMEGTPALNKWPTTNPLRISLADSHAVTSTPERDIIIDGLPVTLTGHIIPDLKIASLFGIQVLTKAGCEVKFDRNKCIVHYNGSIIL